jgi:hypothetical protein
MDKDRFETGDGLEGASRLVRGYGCLQRSAGIASSGRSFHLVIAGSKATKQSRFPTLRKCEIASSQSALLAMTNLGTDSALC